MSHVQFLAQFVRNPARTGAVTASSRSLAHRVAAPLELSSARTVVELGPGTGAFTRQALRSLAPDARYLGVELNGAFVQRLREQLPRIDVVQACAVRLPDLLSEAGLGRADAVISGLPFAAFNRDLQVSVLDAVVSGLAPSGRFATFAYTHSAWIPAARRFASLLRSRFSVVDRSPVVWRNVPPAFVYQCQGPLFR